MEERFVRYASAAIIECYLPARNVNFMTTMISRLLAATVAIATHIHMYQATVAEISYLFIRLELHGLECTRSE